MRFDIDVPPNIKAAKWFQLQLMDHQLYMKNQGHFILFFYENQVFLYMVALYNKK